MLHGVLRSTRTSRPGDGAALALGLALIAVPAAAQTAPATAPPGDYVLDPDRSSLRIGLRFAGGLSAAVVRFTRLDGALAYAPGVQSRSQARITVDTTSAAANAWTKRSALAALDPERWPRASFVSERIEVVGDGAWTMSGRLTLRGVTRPVTLDVGVAAPSDEPATSAGHRLRFVGRGHIRRSEFGIAAPALTRDLMDLRFDVEFAQQRSD